MSGVIQPITEHDGWHIGERFVVEFQIDDGTVGSPPSDIDTWSDVRWYVRENAEDPDLILELTLADEIEFVSPDIFRVTIQPEMTRNWFPGTYWHTLSRIDVIEDLSEGPATIRHSARR